MPVETIEPRDLYRLPWSAVDNVNGWIEPTFRCNLKCTACYRREQQETATFEEMKETVDRTIRMRNCDLISIAGGEPLLVDYLEDLVRYIRGKGVHAMVLTNGVLLDDQRLRSLKAAGLDRINLHVDAGQNRPGWEGRNESDLLELRQHYLDLIHAHGIQCGMIATVYEESHRFLPEVVRWGVRNADKLSALTFDLFRYYPGPRYVKECVSSSGRRVDVQELHRLAVVSEERRYTSQELYGRLREILPGFHPHSYLNGTNKQSEIKWLLSTLIIQRGEVLGYLGSRAVEMATTGYHFLKGRYPSYVGRKPSRTVFAASLFDAEVREALFKYIGVGVRTPGRFFEGVNLLSLAVIQPSDWYTDGLQNMCDACPDAILFGDLLVPSCRLDEYKQFGGKVQAIFRDDIPKNHQDLNVAPGADPSDSARTED